MAVPRRGAPVVAWQYDLFSLLFSTLFWLFYRKVEIWGCDELPYEDAVIFVAGPHSNDVFKFLLLSSVYSS
jgi:1-acyl-sn-glycerol-3-phosphate acyltransferase